MCAMRDAGILEEGYVAASRMRGYSAIRLPWVKKDNSGSEKEPPF